MHKSIWIAVAVGVLASFTHHAPGAPMFRQTNVFEQGMDGYDTFRIPAIVRAQDGALLAFAEGRKNNQSDDGNIDMVLRRSTDQGLTWSPLQVVHDVGDDKIGNPTPVVDDQGKVHLLSVRSDGGYNGREVLNNPAAPHRRPYYSTSTDHGVNWSTPTDISASARRDSWRHYAFGPVHAIQLQRGAHAGRLIIPGNFSIREDNGDVKHGAHILYSDDRGGSWQIGAVSDLAFSARSSGGPRSENDPIIPTESTVVELVNGDIYFNTRDNFGTSEQNRAWNLSKDGGETFFNDAFTPEPDTLTTVVQGALLRMNATDQGDASNRILFSSPNHPIDDQTGRRNMSIWASADEAQSWQLQRSIFAGPSGYSDLVKLDAQTMGILYENGDDNFRERISFAAFNDQWLTELQNTSQLTVTTDATLRDTDQDGDGDIVETYNNLVVGPRRNAIDQPDEEFRPGLVFAIGANHAALSQAEQILLDLTTAAADNNYQSGEPGFDIRLLAIASSDGSPTVGDFDAQATELATMARDDLRADTTYELDVTQFVRTAAGNDAEFVEFRLQAATFDGVPDADNGLLVVRFDSDAPDGSDATDAPQLRWVVPEPGSLGLIALPGAMLLFGRRGSTRSSAYRSTAAC